MSDRDFDVVVIGAGLGGLEVAYTLASEGMSVCVLEKNQQLGGSLQVFSRDKTIFDTGVHYIGGLSPGQNLHRYLSYFGIMDKLKLQRMDMDGYDLCSMGDGPTEYPHAQGYDNFIRRLSEFFPNEKAGITKYTEEIQRMCRRFPLYNLEDRETQEWKDDELGLNAKEHIASMVRHPVLRNVLGGSSGLYAGDGRYSPFYVHALVTNTYIESSWRCVDGGSQIAKHLAHNARAKGAVILNRKEVSGFDFEGTSISAVRTSDGDVFRCKHVIANIHPNTLLAMIGPGHIRPAYRNRLGALRNTTGTFTVHLVMKPKSFPYLNHNHYHMIGHDVWDAVRYDRVNYPNSYMLSTPKSSRGGDHADAVTIMCYMDWDEVAPWAHTHNTIVKPGDRGDGYEEFKRKKEEQILNVVERKFPGLRSCIRSIHSNTPLSFRDFIGSHEGTMYGIMKDASDPLRTFIPPRTKIPNLLLTGQNINLHGILGVTVSSIVTAAELVGKSHLLKKVTAAS
ncbi:MAG: NAD(P)/FAD-dependent oxidoreductase [Flavobacteriales bacterium]